MVRLLKYLKKYRVEAVLAPLFKMIEACFELAVPLVVADMIDVGVANGNAAYIWRTGGILLALGVVGWAFAMAAQYFSARAGMGFGAELRTALFHHVNSLSFRQLDGVGATTLVTRLTADSIQAGNGVNMFLRLFLRAPFLVVGALVSAFIIDWRMGLIFTVATLLTGSVIFYIMKRNLPHYAEIQNTVDGMSETVSENLEGVRVIRAFCNQKEEKARFDDAVEKLKKRQTLAGRIGALHNPLTYIIVNFAIILILWMGKGFVANGELTQGQITALINYMLQILLALTALSHLVTFMTKGLASCKRIADTLSVSPERQEGGEAVADESAPLCEWRGVGYSYHQGAAEAVTGVSLTINRGETVGIIGGTGSGKTTLINLLPRFYPVDSGEVRFMGANVNDWQVDALRGRIGTVPQRAVLFRGTVRSNMKWGNPDATDEEIWRALQIAEAAEFVEEKGEGLDLKIEQGGRNLSGGQRQRLTIARAIVRRPDLLILDDSLSALDYATEARVRKNLAAEGMTVLMIGQRAAAMKSADRILVLDHGKSVGVGTHAELWEHCPVYREICLSQLSAGEVEA